MFLFLVLLQFKDICWRHAPEAFEDLASIFPTGQIGFKDGASITLLPHRYLFVIGKGTYCLGVFDNGQAGTLIGGIAVRNMLVQVRPAWQEEEQRCCCCDVDIDMDWVGQTFAAALGCSYGSITSGMSSDACLLWLTCIR